MHGIGGRRNFQTLSFFAPTCPIRSNPPVPLTACAVVLVVPTHQILGRSKLRFYGVNFPLRR